MGSESSAKNLPAKTNRTTRLFVRERACDLGSSLDVSLLIKRMRSPLTSSLVSLGPFVEWSSKCNDVASIQTGSDGEESRFINSLQIEQDLGHAGAI